MNKKQYIESVNAAKQHSYNYYVKSQPTISDAEFDALVDRIEQTEAEHPDWTLPDSPTQQVGSDLSGNGRRTILHRTPMLSCQKAQTADKVTAWLQKLTKKLGYTPDVMLSWKADGISCSLVYQDGQLIEASTRGDGPTGQDLMQHVRLMATVPQTIPCDVKGCRTEVRGEIVCPKANLNGLRDRNGKQYADCRSAASSLCNQDTPSKDMARLEFWAWELMDCSSCVWQQRVLSDLGFKFCYEFFVGVSMVAFRTLKNLDAMAAAREKISIPVDGIVIRINDNKVFYAQGFTDHHPKGSIAYKFPAQTTTTVIRRIEITVGATGRRTPVAWFDPVTILGRTVEKASLGSEAKMQELGVFEGATVEVGLSNDVIPKIYRVVA
jgi:DNA ligase (NAD+)